MFGLVRGRDGGSVEITYRSDESGQYVTIGRPGFEPVELVATAALKLGYLLIAAAATPDRRSPIAEIETA